jgi:hypothetical protein
LGLVPLQQLIQQGMLESALGGDRIEALREVREHAHLVQQPLAQFLAHDHRRH